MAKLPGQAETVSIGSRIWRSLSAAAKNNRIITAVLPLTPDQKFLLVLIEGNRPHSFLRMYRHPPPVQLIAQ